MVKVKSLTVAQKNYEESASLVPQRYRDGVKGADWQGPASSDNAEELYAAGVQRAVDNKTRQKGVNRITNSDWEARAIDKGGAQIGTAMKKSGSKWQKGFQPYADELERLTLPDKVADAEQNVLNRVVPIAVALANRRIKERG